MIDLRNYSVLAHNTFGIEAKSERFVEYSSVAELVDFVQNDKCRVGMPLMHIGGGSNLLFTGDFKGVILHSAIKGIECVGADDNGCVYVRVGAGEVWDDFVEYAVEHGWYGIENLSLIPGEVGASAVQNIGAYGVEAKDVIVSVETVSLRDGLQRTFANNECEYGYRTSVFKTSLKGEYAVTHVLFRLSKVFCPLLTYGNIGANLPKDKELAPQVLRQTIIDIRKSKLPDPAVYGNAGSFFMNPVVPFGKFDALLADYPNMPYYKLDDGVKIPAGWMIEQCGWKGRALGCAGVHDRQALVLVNLGGATGDDVLALCDAVRKSVMDKFGVEIHPEVNVI
jgi:UDP-N-acetylmuramate dehydrogenase